ncbi:hypothetical protein JQX13_51235 [Archangium violaceum]|uniref:hypothetical protein n=1 Tax=Archangium violaceum TaxID=83451 RepID=UPI00193BEE8C|nr:hypothetical protein [Archangium violaceum]QRK08216.1 hypothetical protein JQX13_51235 [Archangium violaceum]
MTTNSHPRNERVRRAPAFMAPGRLLRRGQAMVEYSAIVFFLALAGGVSIITVIPMLMSALNRYLQGIYFMLNMAVP